MKKLLSFTIVGMFLLIFVLSACSSKSSQTTEDGESDVAVDEEVYELTVAFPFFYSEPQDMRLVEEEINKITKEKINAKVNFVPLSISAYNQQMNLMMTSNENLDLAVIMSNQYSPQVSRGQLVQMDDLIEEHGQGIIDALGTNFLNATKIDGKQFAVASVRDLASAYGFVMRKDLVEKYNIDTDQINTLEDMGDVLRTIKENEPNMEPLVSYQPGYSLLDGLRTVDLLSDGFGVLPGFDNDLKVENFYELPEYVDMLNTFRTWYEEGLILRDIATTQTTKDELIQAGKVFAFTNPLKPGIEEQNMRSIGQEMVAVEIVPPVATTTNVATIMWGVPRNSQNPEKAVQFLNLLYSDKEIINLINWGIEGTHYEKVSDEIIKLPEGVTAENNRYNLNQSWMFGNQFLSYVFEGDDPELWDETARFNDEALKSKALGFSFNSDSVRTEFAAVSNVVEQYKMGLETGTMDPEKTYPEFIERLRAAGIEKIIEEKQRQLDEWVEVNQ